MKNLFFLIIWGIIAIFDYAKFTYIWQLKEYRWRNFRDYFSKNSNRLLIFNPFYFLQKVCVQN